MRTGRMNTIAGRNLVETSDSPSGETTIDRPNRRARRRETD
jgi:hypothetical protein